MHSVLGTLVTLCVTLRFVVREESRCEKEGVTVCAVCSGAPSVLTCTAHLLLFVGRGRCAVQLFFLTVSPLLIDILI